MLDSREELVERSVKKTTESILDFVKEYLAAAPTVAKGEVVYMSLSYVLNAKESKNLEEYGTLNFLFALMDEDIYCRIDSREREYELFLYKRIKGGSI